MNNNNNETFWNVFIDFLIAVLIVIGVGMGTCVFLMCSLPLAH